MTRTTVIFWIAFHVIIVSQVRSQLVTYNTTWSFTTPTTRDYSLHPFNGITRWFEKEDPRLFEAVLRSGSHVDKSLIVKDLVAEEHKNILINCPRHFGRSTMLDVVRKFFEIVVHVDRERIANKTRTRNYRVFNKKNLKIQIAQDKEFFDKHFHTHPVVYMDMGMVLGMNAYGIITTLRLGLGDAFMAYDYIPIMMKEMYPKRMGPGVKQELQQFQKLADSGIEDEDVDVTVELLVKCIHKFFDTKVIVLIDNIDAVVNFALNRGLIKGVAEVIRYLGLVIQAFTANPQYIERTIMTGTSRMYLAGASINLSNLHIYDFLEDHKYAKYCGFSQAEVDTLFDTHYVDDARRRQVKEYYDGYTAKNSNASLYCPFDIIEYVTTGNYRVQNSWIRKGEEVFDHINRHRIWFKLSRFLKYESVLRNFTSLLSTKRIKFSKDVDVTIENIQNFAEMINGTRKKKSFATRPFPVRMYLTYLYEHGFLSTTNEENTYRIPNKQIEDEFHKEYKLFFNNGTSHITDAKLLQDIQSILK